MRSGKAESRAPICYLEEVITAAITAAVAAILALFGVKPGPYLVVVAGVVKGIIVLGAILLASRVARRARKAQSAAPPAPAEPPK
jgi:hypothetical protein